VLSFAFCWCCRQLLDVVSGQPLLPEAISGCGETVVWLDNITLAFTWRVRLAPELKPRACALPTKA
jgi:hypothetical protein